MQVQEIQDNIRSRRNKIFLLMEEVRRLRVQQRIKSVKSINEYSELEVTEMPEITSSIPFLPNVVSYFRSVDGQNTSLLYVIKFPTFFF